MSQWLVCCPSCTRHVQANTHCPFCDTHVKAETAPTTINARLARAAMIGLGAAVALASACAPSPAPTDSGSASDVVDATPADNGGPAPAYGAPAIDGGSE